MQVDDLAANQTAAPQPRQPQLITSAGLESLINALAEDGYMVVGSVLRDGVMALDQISGFDDLPVGYEDTQSPARYAVEKAYDTTLFGSLVGAHSWKQYVFPPVCNLWSATRNATGSSLAFAATEPLTEKYAFLGVRACDLAAIKIQDRVLLEGPHQDPGYRLRREASFIVAVNCTRANDTCFCFSMGTGPRATSGFDLALTEIPGDENSTYVVHIGSDAGVEVLSRIRTTAVDSETLDLARALERRAAEEQKRSVDPDLARQFLMDNLDHPRWQITGSRCLSCGNCTMVCPTCFCTTVEDTTTLSGERAERRQLWDSCFNRDHSYIHGGGVRKSVASRYRQWITHKLATWHDQFGTSGCVGCGRCITWCPVAIDITEEVDAINPNGRVPATPRTRSRKNK